VQGNRKIGQLPEKSTILPREESLYPKERDLYDQIINRPGLNGFDPFADTFSNVRIEFMEFPEEVGNRVGSFGATGPHW
jgi:hypothetical protein